MILTKRYVKCPKCESNNALAISIGVSCPNCGILTNDELLEYMCACETCV